MRARADEGRGEAADANDGKARKSDLIGSCDEESAEASARWAEDEDKEVDDEMEEDEEDAVVVMVVGDAESDPCASALIMLLMSSHSSTSARFRSLTRCTHLCTAGHRQAIDCAST